MKLLLAVNDATLKNEIENVLTYHGYLTETVDNGRDALDYAVCGDYDGMIVDNDIPAVNGLNVLEKLRGNNIFISFMLLTLQADADSRICGLELGADDCLGKPFAVGELLARARAMLHRKTRGATDLISMGNVTLDTIKYTMSIDNRYARITKVEFRMIELFIRNQETYFSADMLLNRLWGFDSNTKIESVLVYISCLRKKLNQYGANIKIITKRGVGYAMVFM